MIGVLRIEMRENQIFELLKIRIEKIADLSIQILIKTFPLGILERKKLDLIQKLPLIYLLLRII